ncbi:neuronal acetylcholine receptor subunit beta-4 [Amyelois transitella]|uniref:neuronal acetylcholine receptor subunit beta-4 n=1 Tax=Amyelois transitella TaxID=680683 RepID=UPI0029904AC8|nr:neuronal acetylcholine receptor subunit beta-4 [Amyelois transitella]
MHTHTLLFLCIFQYVNTEDSNAEKYQEDLLMKYLITKPVTAPNETIEIYAHFGLQFFTFGQDETVFRAFGHLLILWDDERLTWDSSDYAGLAEIVYDSYTFWEPHIRLLNQVDYDEFEYHYGLCRLTNTGHITCLPKIVHEATCHTVVSNWPHDIQNCTLKIGIFGERATIKMRVSDDIVTFILGAEYSAFWTVLNVYQEHSQIDSQLDKMGRGAQIDVTFLLKREGAGLAVAIFVPIITLTIISVYSFLLSSRDLRLGILCFNMLCHFSFLLQISDLIPKHSMDCPTILYYLRGSILVNMFLVMLTIFLSYLRRRTKKIYSMIVSLNDFVFESRARYFVFNLSSEAYPLQDCDQKRTPCSISESRQADLNRPGDNDLNSVNMNSEVKAILKQWNNFADILNSISFYLVIVVYVCFMCLYLPSNPGVEFSKLLTYTYEDLV